MSSPADKHAESLGSEPLPERKWWQRNLYDALCFINRFVFRACYPTTVLHPERIPATGGLLLVSNHQSYFDPPLIGSFIRQRRVTFVARVTLFTFRPLGWFIGAMRALPIHGDGNDTGSIRMFVRALQNGEAVLIFPEGARTFDGSIGEFKRGVLLLVRKADVPVVPIAVAGCFDVWPRQSKGPGRLGTPIGVAYGNPISAEELMRGGPDAALDRLRSEISTLGAELRHAMDARAR
jgi:1-acyl-sn-glycerol-3-phosphate acyltransferase